MKGTILSRMVGLTVGVSFGPNKLVKTIKL